MTIIETIKFTKKMIVDTFKKGKILLLLLFVFNIVEGIYPIIFNILIANLINAVVMMKTNDISKMLILIVFITIIIELLKIVLEYYKSVLGLKMRKDYTERFIDSTKRLRAEEFNDSNFYDSSFAAKESVDNDPFAIYELLFMSISSFVTILGYLGILLVANPLSIVILIVFNIPYFIFNIKAENSRMLQYDELLNSERKVQYYTSLPLEKNFFYEIKIYDYFDNLIDKVNSLMNSIFNVSKLRLKKNSNYTAIAIILNRISIFFIIFMFLFLKSSNISYVQQNFYLVFIACTSLTSLIENNIRVLSMYRFRCFSFQKLYVFLEKNTEAKKEKDVKTIFLNEDKKLKSIRLDKV